MLPGSTVALKKAVRSQWFLDVFGFPVLLQTAWARASTSDVPNVQVSTVIIGTTCWVGSNSSQIWQPGSGSSQHGEIIDTENSDEAPSHTHLRT
jgi:hypothetical protein